jgi:hypothetical protein
LKNFQLRFAPKAFKSAAGAWKIVIQLNLVLSVIFILDLLSIGKPSESATDSEPSGSGLQTPQSEEFQRLVMRLSPLRQVAEILQRRLAGDASSVHSERYRWDRPCEVSVKSGSGWMETICTVKQENEVKDAERVIFNCKEDMEKLWASPIAQKCLKDEQMEMEDHAGL